LLHLVIEFLASRRKDLDAIIAKRIVRCRDDDAGVKAEGACNISHTRRRNDACGFDAGAGRNRAASKRRFDLRPGLACVAANQQARGMTEIAPDINDQGATDPFDRRIVERKLAGPASDAIGSEKLCRVRLRHSIVPLLSRGWGLETRG